MPRASSRWLWCDALRGRRFPVAAGPGRGILVPSGFTMHTAILSRLHNLGIEELEGVVALDELRGDFVNLTCRLPNGTTAKILDDAATYLGTQVECPGSERCYGVAADARQIAVFTYGCGGSDAELVAWVRL